ncbi:MAG: hypothetical protein EHM42_08170, partial [Planctomycetaceae bacterium]
MPIPVECQFCSQKYKVRDQFAGKSVKCKECGGEIRIPEQAGNGKSARGRAAFRDDEDDDGTPYGLKGGGGDWESSFSGKGRPSSKKPPKPLSRTRYSSESADEGEDDDDSRSSGRNRKRAESKVDPRVIVLAAVAASAAVGGGVLFNMAGRKAPQPPPAGLPQIAEMNQFPGLPGQQGGNLPGMPPLNPPGIPGGFPRPEMPNFPPGLPGNGNPSTAPQGGVPGG